MPTLAAVCRRAPLSHLSEVQTGSSVPSKAITHNRVLSGAERSTATPRGGSATEPDIKVGEENEGEEEGWQKLVGRKGGQ